MEVITDINNAYGCETAATVGSFDGVHRGHAAMISEACSIAGENSLPLTVVTFLRHPRLLFSEWETPFLLTSVEEKLRLLESVGVDRCVLLDFDKNMASLSAYDFMYRILRGKINVRMLIVGYDHRFGRPQTGENILSYVDYGKRMGIDVQKAACYAPGNDKISSSRVRSALVAGNVTVAAQLLGRNYALSGRVVHGAALGRRLGFPTANISLDDPLKMLPSDGVYECLLHLDGMVYRGVVNVGCKPTVGAVTHTIEVFIIDFAGDIYDAEVKMEFVRRLRDEQHFASLDDLKRQIEKDVECVILNK